MPQALHGRYDSMPVRSKHSQSTTSYLVLDRGNNIVDVGGMWDEFAFANGGKSAALEMVIATNLNRHITGEAATIFTDRLLHFARQQFVHEPIYYRCDAPGLERTMVLMFAKGARNSVMMIHRLVSQRAVPYTLMFRHTDNVSGVLRCSFCNRLRDEDDWLEPGLFSTLHGSTRSPLFVKYDVCDRCEQLVDCLRKSSGLN